jgi:hypothetical protein
MLVGNIYVQTLFTFFEIVYKSYKLPRFVQLYLQKRKTEKVGIFSTLLPIDPIM